MSDSRRPSFDRVAFVTYFLGAVVPLAALGFVVERYVLPTLDDRLATVGLLGALVSIAVLSLASFLVLGRSTHGSLRRMDRDNRRLAALFETSNSLAEAQDEHAAAAMAAMGALTLSDAESVYVVMRGDEEKPLQIAGSAGEDPLTFYRAQEEDLHEVAGTVLGEGRPLVRGSVGGTPPLLAVAIPGEHQPLGVLLAARGPRRPSFDLEQVDSLSTLARLAGVALHNVDLRDAQRNFFAHVTDILISALDSHLGYNTGHSQRVAKLANRVGRGLGLEEHRLQRLHFGALLHDIGMLKFDRAARKNTVACQKHAAIGARMLGRIRLWQDIAPIVQCHHEWYDGNGYPEGLAAEAIPLEARIIATCDAFDAMTSESSYKAAISPEAALRELERCAGTQFDPKVVEAFLELASRGVIEVDAPAG